MNVLLYLCGLEIGINMINIICSSCIDAIEHNVVSYGTTFYTFIHIKHMDTLIKMH